ncbi:hypothetical protein HMPREF3167_07405 [Trueperella sp. HMSC08B05]|uniref:Membrane lipoprotein lipid attachment site-containing protein n=1 Tax=Trueperella bernardiae TaxID=59561 RepID=A0A0W1KJ12_9ACTO|nr:MULTISPECIES: membrane lipoprotein lipid attachment site-containing protein [Trueperella]KTF03516.1 hypothetical protein AQZ59_01646 [Trueperella bernardiae]MDK8602001.1 membrane lipoprotein lipid attachment site-containing protein [Trueperella bernardiae]OCW60187.1 hypothetical protein AKG36_05380 [Trueperella bernardiae]OFS66916.1 hypothetical protein HMPREF3174_05295 [Trueperella sp. HMSC08H06]OFS72686.1 hypothetical protein HMPREF3167_07405 [Trueperella sp. HMSC08B05]
MKKILATITIALALAGCSDSTSSNETTKPTPEVTRTLSGTYNSVAELRDAAVDAGYTCDNWTDGEWNQGTCSEADFFAVFTNQGSRSAYIHKAQAAGESFTALVGDNWYIAGDEAALKELEGKLDGTVEQVEAAAPADEESN